MVNGKGVVGDIELNLILVLNAFWTTILQPKPNKLLARKLPQNKFFRAGDTIIVI